MPGDNRAITYPKKEPAEQDAMTGDNENSSFDIVDEVTLCASASGLEAEGVREPPVKAKPPSRAAAPPA